jgi:molecular chaperone HtpG
MSEEVKKFDTEVGKILQLMIHSLYTNKEIFIRELISNASDACDKLRYLSQSDESLIKDDPELKIWVSIDKEAGLLKIRDNGIGMNKEDLIENLGTIARSGTQHFVDQLSGDDKKDNMLIGQFGVGFYSSYMVSDKVDVITKKAGEKEAFLWSSKGEGEYSIKDTKADFERGTEITLHIKESEDAYLDHFKVKHIIKSYSDHIEAPIYFIDAETKHEIKLNSSSALWTRSKSEITDEQYQEFYKTVSYAADEPWITMHNKNEGVVEFTNLLFVPTNQTFDLFHPDRKRRVKLYIKRVFISDENIDIVPHYLRFIRGVVDSEDLPLNISRETLQHNSTIEKIKTALTKRTLNELLKKQKDDRETYGNFWNNFGPVIKEGLCEAMVDHEKILDTCLFKSALHHKDLTLAEYIENFKPDQKIIYYLSGEDAGKLKNSPQIEGFLQKGIDVLLFTDSVDDFWVQNVGKYKDFEIKSVTRADIEIDSVENKKEDKKKKSSDKMGDLIGFFKETLGDLVKDVKISKKLTSSPSCLAIAEGAMDMRMERYLVEQKQLGSISAKILELNPDHQIIKRIEANLGDKELKEDNTRLALMLFDQACIIEGEPIRDPSNFCKQVNDFIERMV